jgi:hypothetical protein
MDYNNDGSIIRHSKLKAKKEWPNEYHYTKHLFPLKKYKFNDFYLWGPRNCGDYLNRSYGNDWNQVAYLQYDHKNMKHYKKKKFLLKDIV